MTDTEQGLLAQADDADDQEPTAPSRAEVARGGRRRLHDVLAGATTLAATYVLVGLSYGWARIFSAAPISQQGDAAFYLALARTIGQTGWWTSAQRLGFPNGQTNFDFPLGADTQSILMLRLIRVVTTEPGRMVNLFYLATFLGAALSAFVVLRLLGCRATVSVPLATAFATLPYHFARSEWHLFLSSYWAVPVGVFVILRADRLIPWLRDGFRRGGGRRLARPLGLVVIAWMLAGNGFYYAFFFLFALALVSVARAMARRDVRQLLGPIAVAGLVASFVGILLLPSLIYKVQHGPNNAPVTRSFTDQELYGLRLVELVTPSTSNRIHALARLGGTTNQGFGAEIGTAHLGTLGTIGLATLMVVCLVGLLDRRTTGGFTARHEVRSLALLTVVLMVFAAPAGLGGLVSLAGLKEVRAWNRASVVIGFAALAALGLLLETALSSTAVVRWRARWPVRFGAMALIPLVIAGVYADQVPALRPTVQQTTNDFNAYRLLAHDVEQAFGPDAKLFTWPILRYPASQPRGSVEAYDSLLLYAYSTRLRLSAGAMMGRPADWTEPLTYQPAERLVRSAALAGFDAFFFDRGAFTSTQSEQEFESAITGTVGTPLVSDVASRRVVFDLRPLRASLTTALDPALAATAAEHLVKPVKATFGGDAYAEDQSVEGFTRWLGPNSSLSLSNPWSTDRDVRIQLTLTAPASAGAAFTVTGAAERTVVVGPNPTTLVLSVHLPPGQNARLAFTTNAGPFAAPGDVRDLRVLVSRGLITDQAVEQALSGP